MVGLDHSIVVEVLVRNRCNIFDAAKDLGVPSPDLRRLMWANPKMQEAAFEQIERRLDKAEANVHEALHSEDSRRRDAASFFVLRNTARARRRGWVTSATSAAAELSIIDAPAKRTVTFRFRTDEDDEAEKAVEREQLEAEGNKVIDWSWDAPDKTIEHEPPPSKD
jgi:hypothetical protein